MIFSILFLILILFFPDITLFGSILFAIYMICTMLPEIAAAAQKKEQRKKAENSDFHESLFVSSEHAIS